MRTLKHTFVLGLLLICSGSQLYAQSDSAFIPYHMSNPGYKVYGSAGGGMPSNTYLGLTLIHPSNFGANINLSYASFSNKSGGFFGPPPDELTMLNFNFVKEILFKSPFVRFGLEAGLSYVVFNEKKNITSSVVCWLIPIPVYTYDEVISRVAGLNFRVKLEVPFSLAFGLETSVVVNLNQAQSFLGFNLGFTLGKVRDKRYRGSYSN